MPLPPMQPVVTQPPPAWSSTTAPTISLRERAAIAAMAAEISRTDTEGIEPLVLSKPHHRASVAKNAVAMADDLLAALSK